MTMSNSEAIVSTTPLQRRALQVAGQANGWRVSTPPHEEDDSFEYQFTKGDAYLDVCFHGDGSLREAWTATPPWNHGPIPDVTLPRLMTFLRER